MSGRLVGLRALSKHCYLPTVVPVTQLWWFLAFLYGCTILPCGKWAAFLITFILLWIHVLKLFHLKTVSCAKISQLFLGYCVCNVSLLWENWKSDFLKSLLDNSSCNLPAEFFSLALAVRPGPWPDQVQSGHVTLSSQSPCSEYKIRAERLSKGWSQFLSLPSFP